MLAMATWRFRAERCFGIRGPGEDNVDAQSLGYEELGLVLVGLVRVNEALESLCTRMLCAHGQVDGDEEVAECVSEVMRRRRTSGVFTDNLR
jgi:hypothetical protein